MPLLVFFLGPVMIGQYTSPEGVQDWAQLTAHLYRYIVRPIAVGGMLVGACFTLWKMRKNLIVGIKRGVADVKKSASAAAPRGPHAAGPVRSRSCCSASRSSPR